MGFQMLCAKTPSELEAVETHESELAMAHVMYNTALREAAREKGMRNNHMRCNVCVHREPDEEQSANYCFGVGKVEIISVVMSSQFLQDITKVAARSKT